MKVATAATLIMLRKNRHEPPLHLSHTYERLNHLILLAVWSECSLFFSLFSA